MWLRQELNSICLKEFALRHQLDLLQDNAYISFNIRQLSALLIEATESNTKNWSETASRCNTYWFNIVGYLKLFPDVFSTLDQKRFLIFQPIVLKENTYIGITKSRIQSCFTFLDISRAVVYSGQLRELHSRLPTNRELFSILSEGCRHSDPPGTRIVAIENRIAFLRAWLGKLVIKHQIGNIFIPRSTAQIPAKIELGDTSNNTQPHCTHQEFVKFVPLPIVSATKVKLRISRVKKHPSRLSEILGDLDDSDSCSSSNSVWEPPFKRAKPNVP